MGKHMRGNLLRILASSMLALLCLALGGTPASASDLRPAFHIGGDPVAAPAQELQLDAAVASDGADFLVVWDDARALSYSDIYGVRVTSDGTLLDEAGIAITTAANNQDTPAAAFGASGYLVVWKDDRSGSSDIYGSRVAVDGSVLDASGISISAAAGGQGYPAVAFGDSVFLVAWADNREATQHIYGARVQIDGTVLDPDGIAICSAANGQSYPAVAYDGTAFLVVWEDLRNSDGDIYGARVAADGTVLDPGGIAISTASGDQTVPGVTSNGASWLAVWEDSRNGTVKDIYGARVLPDGSVLNGGGIPICTQSAEQSNAAVSFDGQDWFVIWNDYRQGSVFNTYAARVDSSGAVLDANGFVVCPYLSQQYNPAVATADSMHLIAWHDSRNGVKDIYGARVAADGTVLQCSMAIAVAPSPQANPAVAFDGTNYLAVWQDLRLGSANDIYGIRVGSDESLLDPAGIAISASSGDQACPAVAPGSAAYLVAWQDYRNGAYDIYAARVTASGTVLDVAGIAVSTASGAQEYPAVASDGADYLAVWQDARAGSYDIYGARLTAGGVVLDASAFVISNATGDQLRPAVAFDGNNYFVVWNDYRNGSAYDIYGARVSPAGVVLDASGIAVSTATGAQEYPAIAHDGMNYLVVWQDRRGGPYADIYAARVAGDGTVIDAAGIAVSTATYDQAYPAVTFEGSYYLVAWQDSRRATRPDVFGARVGTDGAVLDATGFVISAASYSQLAPAVSAGIPGQVLAAYSSFTHAPLYGSNRIWANFYGAASDVPLPDTEPDALLLARISPNPFSGSTVVRFCLAEKQAVTINVYDVRGQLVAGVFDGVRGAGSHEVVWNGTGPDGAEPAPGIYFCRVGAGDRTLTSKMILLD